MLLPPEVAKFSSLFLCCLSHLVCFSAEHLLSDLFHTAVLKWNTSQVVIFTVLFASCSHSFLHQKVPHPVVLAYYDAHLMQPLLHHHLVHTATIVVLLLHGFKVAAAWVLEFDSGVPSPGTHQGHSGKQDAWVDVCHLRALQWNTVLQLWWHYVHNSVCSVRASCHICWWPCNVVQWIISGMTHFSQYPNRATSYTSNSAM